MEYDLNIREYWRILKKRKWIILLSALLTGVFSFGMGYINKPAPTYKAVATLKIEKTSTTTGIFLEALSWSGADYLETQINIITSYPIVELTAKELGLIPSKTRASEIRSNRKLINIVMDLKDQITSEREGDSNLVNIIAESSKPKDAQKIANTLTRVYQREHAVEINKRTFETRSFIEKQMQEVAAKLTAAEENLAYFKKTKNVISLDDQTASLLNQLTSLEVKRQNESQNLEEMEIVLKRLKAVKPKSMSTKDSFFINNAPTLYNNLNSKITNLLLEKEGLLLNFTTAHPKVVEINTQLEDISLNMTANLVELVATAHSRLDSLNKKIANYQKKFNVLPDKGLNLARLERNVNFNEKIYSLLEEKLQEAKIKAAAQIEEVVIIKPALEPTSAINNSKYKMKAIMGMIVGLVIGLLLAFIYETFDTSIGAVQEVEEFVGTKVLGIIPDIDGKNIKSLLEKDHPGRDLSKKAMRRIVSMIPHFIPNSTISECYRSVRTNVQFSGFDKPLKTIVFTSAVANEGKTTTIVNVAIAIAQAYNRVLLIDADLRKPDLARVFGISDHPGLTEVILGSYEWQEVVKDITDLMLGDMELDDIMLTPGLDNLHIITSGRMPLNPAELLTSKEFDNFFKAVYDHYDIVLLDLPPVLAAADTTIIGSRVDGVVMVYRAGTTARGSLWRAKEQLDHARANTVGIILNGLKAEVSLDFGEMYTRRYEYGTENDSQAKIWYDRLKRLSPKMIMAKIFGRTKSSSAKTTPNKTGIKTRSKILFALLASSLIAIGLHFLNI